MEFAHLQELPNLNALFPIPRAARKDVYLAKYAKPHGRTGATVEHEYFNTNGKKMHEEAAGVPPSKETAQRRMWTKSEA
jgi:hypothetical protein